MNINTLINAGMVFKQFKQVKLSSGLAYKIMKFCKSIDTEEEFYMTRKNEIINTYAVKDESGKISIDQNGMVDIIPDKISEANAAMRDLNNLEVEAPNIRFTLAELEELKLSVADMFALDAFIEE